MERLWAAWRNTYVSSLDQPAAECVFCELTKQEDGPENLVLHRGETCYIVLNLYPYNNGHAMVLPYRHTQSLEDLTDEERSEMMRLAALVQRALAERKKAQGFNLGMNLGRVGGAGIPGHLHLHVVPRWPGDTNFMPVVGQTKVLSEALDVTYEKLREGIADILKREGAAS
ncbi:MAG: HIT domain-containing protein [Gemmatimonadetes bacterium]|nr:HIT domain-containing protein [Gemmatimonadota bacterium]